MPDRDDLPEFEPHPMDEAYLRAEQALDDETERAARRAKVLAAVARQPATPPAPMPAVRRPIRRYGGWLAAACVAGLSVWTATTVYRLSPRPLAIAQPPPPVAAQPPAPSAAAGPASAPVAAPAAPAVRANAPKAALARAAPQADQARAPVAPPPDIAPPPPLALPPVMEPIRSPPAPAPPPPPPPIAAAPAPAATVKAGAAAPAPNTELQSVVVTGSRIARKDYTASSPNIARNLAAPPPAISSSSALLKTLDGPARLRDAAAAGRTADIEALLAQGVPVDAPDDTGETALMKAVKANQLGAAALLLRNGASLDHKTPAGVSVRDLAAQRDDAALDRALGISP